MPLPSEADLRTAIGKNIKISNETLKFGNANTPNIVTMAADYLDEIPTDSASGAQSAIQAFRGQIASLCGGGATAQCLDPLWTTYGRVKLYADDSPTAVLDRLYDTFATTGTPVTVKSRGFTFNTYAAGASNVGTGVPARLTKDRFDYNIENVLVADAQSLTCVADANSGGTMNNESFLYRGSAPGYDALELNGTGLAIGVQALSGESATSMIQNGSFENGSPTGASAAITDLTGWTVASSWTNFETVVSDVYKSKLSTGQTSRSLRIKTNDSISQTWLSRGGISWPALTPMFAQIAFKRESSCDGTLTVTIGSKTMSVVLAAQSGWTILRWTLDKTCWLKEWDTTPYTGGVTIALSSNTTGDLLVDDLIIAPMTNVNGTWLALPSGATPFLNADTFTVTDSCTESGIIQKWVARAYGRYFPSTTGSPVWADPT